MVVVDEVEVVVAVVVVVGGVVELVVEAGAVVVLVVVVACPPHPANVAASRLATAVAASERGWHRRLEGGADGCSGARRRTRPSSRESRRVWGHGLLWRFGRAASLA